VGFSLSSLPLGQRLSCRLERFVKGLNKFNPHYKLFEESTGTYLLTAVKRFNAVTPYYAIGINEKDTSFDEYFYLGKLRGFTKSEYILYDKGPDSSKAKTPLEARTVMAKIIF
jgi:hypothetical protein